MRALFFVFVLTFTLSVSAQSSLEARLFDDGVRMARVGEFEKAASVFKRSVVAARAAGAADQFLARVHFNLGVCEYRLGLGDKAAEHLQRAIALMRGDYPHASYALGMTELGRGRWSGARRAFLRSLETDAADGEVWFDLACAYLGEGDLGRAESAFRNSVLRGSADADLGHNNIGVILALRGEISEAATEFETALELSGGRLLEARANLEYCRLLSTGRTGLVAKLEYGKRVRSITRHEGEE